MSGNECKEENTLKNMSILQLREELFQSINPLLDDKEALKELIKFVKILKAQETTVLLKEKFYAKLERGEEEYRQGKCHTMKPGETLDGFLNRIK